MRYSIVLLLFVFVLRTNGQSLFPTKGILINTPYHFSVTIPTKEWKLLSKQEIEEQKKIANNQNLRISAIAYLGNKNKLDDIPHLYVTYHPQPKIGEKGFEYSSKMILSSYLRDSLEKYMSEKFPEWSFEINNNYYNVDTVRRMVMFSSTTKYDDGDIRLMIYCFFLMETGIAQINFSFAKTEIGDYKDFMKQVIDSVKIDTKYILVKD